jgi:hypothetical protein
MGSEDGFEDGYSDGNKDVSLLNKSKALPMVVLKMAVGRRTQYQDTIQSDNLLILLHL